GVQSSEQLAFLRGFILTVGHDLIRNIGFLPEFEEAVPRLGTPRKDHVSGSLVLPDKDLAAFETKIGRQADRLTPAIEKELCSARHGWPPKRDIYHDVLHDVKGLHDAAGGTGLRRRAI